MASYTIHDAQPEKVYCVVTQDDGSTFGQWVYGEASKTEGGIRSAISDAIARVSGSPLQRDQAVMEAVRARTRVTLDQPDEKTG